MTSTTVTSKPYLQRLWIYSKEMFPVLIYLPYVIALYLGMNFLTQAVSGQEIIIDTYGIVGMISAFFVMLQMRTFDDLKDFDLDKDLFPWRATARGDVKKSDIFSLMYISIGVLIIINLLFGQKTIVIFVIMMVYTIMTYKWFFAEQYHRNRPFFTMITHQPIPWVINFYLIHTALASGGTYQAFTGEHWILLLIFTLPVTAWEVSRKIRAVGNETHYETFSLLIGTRTATIIPFIALLLSGALGIYIANLLGLSESFYGGMVILISYVCFIYGRFLVYPTKKNNILTNTAMIFTTLLFANLLVHLLMNTGVEVNL
jgi:hypothetical protein